MAAAKGSIGSIHWRFAAFHCCSLWWWFHTVGVASALGLVQQGGPPSGATIGGGGGGEVEYDGYYSDLSSGVSRPSQATCVDIPKNMSLCHNIGYHRMRLPNLLDHDTLQEAYQQSKAFNPLLNIHCHMDTQLFLCSLFSPVCLERPIYPCRSLCEKVKEGCEKRMSTYGFPWPEMFRCDKFPMDNDMCITAQSTNLPTVPIACNACNQAQTYENILDNFCRADFALKTKIKNVTKSQIVCKKSKIFKRGKSLSSADGDALRRPKFDLDNMDDCCKDVGKKSRAHYLIMGQKMDSNLVPTFIMKWSHNSASFRKAVRRFQDLDCSNPKIVSESMVVDGAIAVGSPFKEGRGSPSDKRHQGRKTHGKRHNRPSSNNNGRNSRKVRGGRKGNKDNLFSTANANVTFNGKHSSPFGS